MSFKLRLAGNPLRKEIIEQITIGLDRLMDYMKTDEYASLASNEDE